MPDPRSVMKEFRSLDEKRVAAGLTPAEEARYAHLRDLVGPEVSPRRGFDVDAAAAQLRESLLPAGLRNRPPAAAAPAEPDPAPEREAADALAAAFAAEPLAVPAPAEAAVDPASLADALPAEWDPNAAWDPNAPGAAAQAWDPSAQAYDPNAQPYDPNAPAYDASQPYDPAAPGYDPNAPYDPNAAYDPNAPPYDASQPYDPAAQPAWDPNVAWDPNAPDAAAQGSDPAAQPWDPNAQPYDPNAQPYDPNAPASDASAQAYDPGAQPWDAAQGQVDAAAASWDVGASYDADAPVAQDALAYDPAALPEAGVQPYPPPDLGAPTEADPLGEPGPAAGGSPSEPEGVLPEGWAANDAASAGEGGAAASGGDDGGLESLLPFDAAAAAAIVPGEVPDGFGRELGEYDDTAAFERGASDAAPADLPGDEPGFHAAQAVEPEAAEAWQPHAALDDGFQLESGGSFDATADAAAPEWAGGTAAPPWQSVTPAMEVASGAFAAPEGEPFAEPQPLSEEDFAVDVDAPPGAPGELELAAPDLSAAAPPEEEAAFVDAATARPDATDAAFEVAGAADAAVSPLELDAAPATEPAPLALEDDGIPTIDGEEILEEIPPEDAAAPIAAEPLVPEPEPAPDAPALHAFVDPEAAAEPATPIAPPAPPPEAIPAPPVEALAPVPVPAPATASEPGEWVLPGAHRVVVHTVEGQVRRGVLEDVDLGAATLALAAQPGAPPDDVPSDKIKAIFFMLAPGGTAPAPEGKKVRVTFRDGRQVAGFSPDYRDTGIGFFMIPVDTRTNTGRIWVYRSAVRQVSVS